MAEHRPPVPTRPPADPSVVERVVPLLLRVDEVAELLSMSVDWVYEHGAELGLVKLGGANRYVRSNVEAYVVSLLHAERSPAPVIPAPSRQGSPRNGRRRVPLLETRPLRDRGGEL